MKQTLLAIVLIISSLALNAQSSSTSTTATYKVQLGAYAQPVNLSNFDNVRDLGVILTEPNGNGLMRVSLGTYLDKYTAQKIASKAQSRGYSSAYAVVATKNFVDENGQEQTHTLQFSANKSLDLKPVVSKLKADGVGQLVLNDIYVRYSSGYYRYSLGLFAPSNTSLQSRYNTALRNIGISETFVRQFRVSTGIGTTPLELPKDPLPSVTTTTTVTSKPKEPVTNAPTDKDRTGATNTSSTNPDTQKDRTGATNTSDPASQKDRTGATSTTGTTTTNPTTTDKAGTSVTVPSTGTTTTSGTTKTTTTTGTTTTTTNPATTTTTTTDKKTKGKKGKDKK